MAALSASSGLCGIHLQAFDFQRQELRTADRALAPLASRDRDLRRPGDGMSRAVHGHFGGTRREPVIEAFYQCILAMQKPEFSGGLPISSLGTPKSQA